MERALSARQLAPANFPSAQRASDSFTTRYPVSTAITNFLGQTPVAAQLLALPDDRKQTLIAHSVEQLASYVDDTGLAVPAENHFLTASKPG